MVYSVRLRSGIVLARECFVEADIVSSVPESGTAAAHGFSMKVSFCIQGLTSYYNFKNRSMEYTYSYSKNWKALCIHTSIHWLYN